jgi:hypothetical protein
MITIDVTLGLTSAILSFAFFLSCRYLISPLTYSRLCANKSKHQTISSPYIRTWFTYVDEVRWQRLNLLISWIHALITGVLVLYSFLVYSGLRADFVDHVNLVTYVTCSLSFGMCLINEIFEMKLFILGYFCYDLCDVISNRKGIDLLEIGLHHIVVSKNYLHLNQINKIVSCTWNY